MPFINLDYFIVGYSGLEMSSVEINAFLEVEVPFMQQGKSVTFYMIHKKLTLIYYLPIQSSFCGNCFTISCDH